MDSLCASLGFLLGLSCMGEKSIPDRVWLGRLDLLGVYTDGPVCWFRGLSPALDTVPSAHPLLQVLRVHDYVVQVWVSRHHVCHLLRLGVT